VQPRPELVDLLPAVHGSAPPSAGVVLDFSVSSNPLGPAPAVVAAARDAAFGRYPESDSATLRAAIANQLEMPAAGVVVGNGSVELIWLCALAFLERGDRAFIVGPTFAEYARAARLAGADVTEYRADGSVGFRVDVADLCRAIEAAQPRVTYVCNPNNPTGTYLARGQVEALLAATPGLLVLDEAYVAFADDAWDAHPLLRNERLVLVRSMTKDHALAGLRLGYALGAPTIMRAIQWAQPPWSVNAAAQAAGLVALAEGHHVAQGRTAATLAKEYLISGLRSQGLVVLPSAANFFLLEVPDAASVAIALRHQGIYVRDCTSFGLPQHIRIAARPLDECAALLAALSRVQSGNATALGARL
jgi:histidinol-phosphate aminotransferase